MNEQYNTTVAETCPSTCQFTESRPLECPDAKGPVEASGTYNGQRVENPSQSAASEGKHQSNSKTDMEGICLSGSRNLVKQEESRQTERLETVGNTTGGRGKSLYPQNQAELVGGDRPSGIVNTENVMRLLEYQNYRCALTGRELSPELASLDHIVPIRLGGEHTMENVQVLHKDVNRAKNSLTNDEFIGICREIVQLFQNRQQRF